LNLTDRQQAILDFVVNYYIDSKRMPSLKEIADEFSISVGATIGHLNALQKKGHLTMDPGKHRSIQLSHYRTIVEAI